MLITILPSYVASMGSYAANLMLLHWTPMYSYVHVFLCYSYEVAIVAYKTNHRPLFYVITLENPRKGNTRTAKKTPGYITITWMVHQGGGSEKEHPVY